MCTGLIAQEVETDRCKSSQAKTLKKMQEDVNNRQKEYGSIAEQLQDTLQKMDLETEMTALKQEIKTTLEG